MKINVKLKIKIENKREISLDIPVSDYVKIK